MAAPDPIQLRFPAGSVRDLSPEPGSGPVKFQFFPYDGAPSQTDIAIFAVETEARVELVSPVAMAGPFSIDFDGGADPVAIGGATSVSILSALNSLPGIQSAGLVSEVLTIAAGLFHVRFSANGARNPIEIVHPTRGDLTANRVSSIQTGTGSLPSIQQIDLRVKLLALVTDGDIDTIGAGSITAAVETAGTADNPQHESIDFGDTRPESGSLTISDDAGTTWSGAVYFGPRSPRPYDVKSALDSLDDGAFRVAFSRGDRRWDIQRTASGVIANALTVTSAVRWPEGKECTIDFHTARRAVEQYLPGASEVRCRLILKTGDDLSDSTVPSRSLLIAPFTLQISGPEVSAPPVFV